MQSSSPKADASDRDFPSEKPVGYKSHGTHPGRFEVVFPLNCLQTAMFLITTGRCL